MAGNKAAYCGLIFVVPENAVAKTSSNSGKSKSLETQISRKTQYNHFGGGCSTEFTETYKSGGFVNGRNGNHGYKEEVSHKSSFKVNDKIHGCTTQYETEVKHKKVTTYNKPSKSSDGVKFDKKVGNSAKPRQGSGGVTYKKIGISTNYSSKGSGGAKLKTVTTYTHPNKSSGGSGSRSYGCSKKLNY